MGRNELWIKVLIQLGKQPDTGHTHDKCDSRQTLPPCGVGERQMVPRPVPGRRAACLPTRRIYTAVITIEQQAATVNARWNMSVCSP